MTCMGDRCRICGRPIDAAWSGGDVHPACFAQRLPEDTVVALVAAAVLLLAPAIVVWAG
jgi:hypothetical protein